MECGDCLVIACILFFRRWEVLSWAVILVAKSKKGDCETTLAPLLGFLIGFVIADLCRVKAARENSGFGFYKIASSPQWPSSLGPSVRSCSLLRRWPGVDPPPRASPSGHRPLTAVAATHPPHPLLSSPLRGHFLQRPSVWPSGEPLILSALQISRMGCQHLFQRLALARRPSTSHFKWESCSEGWEWGLLLRNFFLSGSDTAAFDVFTNSELRRITVLLTNHKVEDKWQMLRAEPEWWGSMFCWGGGSDVEVKMKDVCWHITCAELAFITAELHFLWHVEHTKTH